MQAILKFMVLKIWTIYISSIQKPANIADQGCFAGFYILLISNTVIEKLM